MKQKSNTSSADFQSFWDAYGVKRDRIAAERAWKKLSAKERVLAISGIARYRDACQRSGISMMYAQGYLNHHRWEDEPAIDAVPAATAPYGVAAKDSTASACCNAGWRIDGGITEAEHDAFSLMREELLGAVTRHIADTSGLRRMVEGLSLVAVHDGKKCIAIRLNGHDFDREFAATYYWELPTFDSIVAARFNGFRWTGRWC